MNRREFAIEHQLDSVQFNTLRPFESIEEKHLSRIRYLREECKVGLKRKESV